MQTETCHFSSASVCSPQIGACKNETPPTASEKNGSVTGRSAHSFPPLTAKIISFKTPTTTHSPTHQYMHGKAYQRSSLCSLESQGIIRLSHNQKNIIRVRTLHSGGPDCKGKFTGKAGGSSTCEKLPDLQESHNCASDADGEPGEGVGGMLLHRYLKFLQIRQTSHDGDLSMLANTTCAMPTTTMGLKGGTRDKQQWKPTH